MLHFPVLLEESVDFLINELDGHYIDCTFGRGGHSKLILEKISSKGYLSSFDKDPEAYEFGLNFNNDNFKFVMIHLKTWTSILKMTVLMELFTI